MGKIVGAAEKDESAGVLPRALIIDQVEFRWTEEMKTLWKGVINHAVDLDSQSLSPLLAPAGNDLAAALSAHPRKEAVGPFSLGPLGTIRDAHRIFSPLVVAHFLNERTILLSDTVFVKNNIDFSQCKNYSNPSPETCRAARCGNDQGENHDEKR